MNIEPYIPFILIPFIGWGVRHYLIKKNDFTTYKKRTFTIGIIAYFLTEIGRSFYRPYIYSQGIHDFFIADTLGNSLGTVTAIFMILTLAGKGTRQDWKLVGMVTAGLMGYEWISAQGGHGFDANDIWATCIFAGLSAPVVHWLLKTNTSPAIDKSPNG